MTRLFEVATADEWREANTRSAHLDIWQALNYLANSQEHDIVRVKAGQDASRAAARRKRIGTYALRLGLSVETKMKSGWIFIKDVTTRRQLVGKIHRRRLPETLRTPMTVSIALQYDGDIPSDKSLIDSISRGLSESGHPPLDILVTAHQLADEANCEKEPQSKLRRVSK